MLLIGTNWVHDDEPAYGLCEAHEMQPSQIPHRIQTLTVMRGGKPVDYRQDLGPACNFKASQFAITGGVCINGKYDVVETAGRLMEMADGLRDNPTNHTVIGLGSDMLKGYQQIERRRNANKN